MFITESISSLWFQIQLDLKRTSENPFNEDRFVWVSGCGSDVATHRQNIIHGGPQ